MTAQWKAIDLRIAAADPTPMVVRADTGEQTEMPEELRTKVMNVMCNDCGHRFDRLFSPYNLYKCGDPEGKGCGSYNTVI